jgi:glycosyltransferase involved in cell wall biosynthesis
MARVRPTAVMLLDNHYGPDARVAFERELLADAGIASRVVAWDRRPTPGAERGEPELDVLRLSVPARSAGGWRTLVALVRFSTRVWRTRHRLLAGASLLIVHDVYLLPLGWALARNLHLPFVYDAHEQIDPAEAGLYPPWLLRLVTAAETRLARDAEGVVVPGVSRTGRWAAVLERPLIVLPNFRQRDQAPVAEIEPEWDLLYAGTLTDERRLDLLVELARLRPELRVAIAGGGRSATVVEASAKGVANLDVLGWRDDVEPLFGRARCLYYGLDPTSPYSEFACPNTLYQALRHRKPLLFFCGGEPAEVASAFRIGIRCEPTAGALSRAVDEAVAREDWQFDEAWRRVWDRSDPAAFVRVVAAAAANERPGPAV